MQSLLSQVGDRASNSNNGDVDVWGVNIKRLWWWWMSRDDWLLRQILKLVVDWRGMWFVVWCGVETRLQDAKMQQVLKNKDGKKVWPNEAVAMQCSYIADAIFPKNPRVQIQVQVESTVEEGGRGEKRVKKEFRVGKRKREEIGLGGSRESTQKFERRSQWGQGLTEPDTDRLACSSSAALDLGGGADQNGRGRGLSVRINWGWVHKIHKIHTIHAIHALHSTPSCR